jgi:16S rRNA (guanine966-N2)-methyltransferase
MSRVAQKKAARSAASAHRLRIVGGRWRGSRIDFPDVAAIRPTPDRVRETLFNWLQQQIVGAHCLDLFAGSGALGFEALSRGAAHVTFVDREPRIVRHLEATLRRFHASNADIVLNDAALFLQHPSRRFDIVFLDPPFAADLLVPTFRSLADGWLAPGAFVYVECPAQAPLPEVPQGWTVFRSKRAGQVGYHLLRAVAPT